MVKIIYQKGNDGPVKVNRRKALRNMSTEEQMRCLFGLGRK